MSIIIHSVKHVSDDYGNEFFVATFDAGGKRYETALIDHSIDRSLLDLDFDQEMFDTVDEAIKQFFLHDHPIDPEPYDIDELTNQAMLLGHRMGKRYVLDELGNGIELVELTERARKRVAAFNSRAETALWLRHQLDDNALEKGPLKQVNANIPEALHDDFKALCVRRRVDMQDVLARLIIEWMR